jgi:VWFA-related protein
MRFVTVPLAFAAFGVVVMTLAVQAQSSQKPKPPPRFEVNVDAVTLDVVVTDKKGRFVKDLKQEDFAVLEEGVPQELEFFTAENTPVTVMVLLDSSASVRSSLDIIQKSANRFLDKLRRGDQARVGLFHERVIFGPRFTDDMDEHIAMIRNMLPHRSTHLYDALYQGLEQLSMVQDRKALFLFTDGDDEGSTTTREDAVEAARRSYVSIYCIGFLGWNWVDGMDINEDLLTQLAQYSGGSAFYPMNEKEMRKSFDRIQDELHRQYRMAYFPKERQGEDVWRHIEVKMTRRRNLTVRTRQGYYSSTVRVR